MQVAENAVIRARVLRDLWAGEVQAAWNRRSQIRDMPQHAKALRRIHVGIYYQQRRVAHVLRFLISMQIREDAKV